jgi:hypothetical protein
MDVKTAVANAKRHILEVMSDESIEPPSLEEVWFDKKNNVWKVTLGVRRRSAPDTAAGRLGLSLLPTYKTVTVADDDGNIVSLRDRMLDGLKQ